MIYHFEKKIFPQRQTFHQKSPEVMRGVCVSGCVHAIDWNYSKQPCCGEKAENMQFQFNNCNFAAVSYQQIRKIFTTIIHIKDHKKGIVTRTEKTSHPPPICGHFQGMATCLFPQMRLHFPAEDFSGRETTQ